MKHWLISHQSKDISTISRTELRLSFSEYYIDLSTPETTKLLGSNEEKITQDKNSENAPLLENTEAALVLCNILNNQNVCVS